jgi:hypothetical protein
MSSAVLRARVYGGIIPGRSPHGGTRGAVEVRSTAVDIVAPSVVIQAVGRWGNYQPGLYGPPTTLPWGSRSNAPTGSSHARARSTRKRRPASSHCSCTSRSRSWVRLPCGSGSRSGRGCDPVTCSSCSSSGGTTRFILETQRTATGILRAPVASSRWSRSGASRCWPTGIGVVTRRPAGDVPAGQVGCDAEWMTRPTTSHGRTFRRRSRTGTPSSTPTRTLAPRGRCSRPRSGAIVDAAPDEHAAG